METFTLTSGLIITDPNNPRKLRPLPDSEQLEGPSEKGTHEGENGAGEPDISGDGNVKSEEQDPAVWNEAGVGEETESESKEGEGDEGGFAISTFTRNAMPGKWVNRSENGWVVFIHSDYRERDLSWSSEKYGCVGTPSGRLGIYDLFEYRDWEEKGVEFDPQCSFGLTVETEGRERVWMDYGYNEDGVVCGAREAVCMGYNCDECQREIKGGEERYSCNLCENYDQCSECFNGKITHPHGAESFRKIIDESGPPCYHDHFTENFDEKSEDFRGVE